MVFFLSLAKIQAYCNQVKKFLCLYFLLFLNSIAFSQTHFYAGIFAGSANYKGDLGRTSFISNTRGVWGFGMFFQLNRRMLIRTEMYSGNVSGTDKFDAKTRSRNLNFTSKITEFSLSYEYILFDLYEYKVSPYAFIGVGTFKFSPYTKNKNGNVVFLAEQSTEGQGFYKDRKDYKLQQLAIPFGGGMQWALSPTKRIALEVGIRKTFTDYLDDVSTTYIDPALLAQERGSTAVSLAYRAVELPNALPYPADGSKRGNPDTKDWYFFSGVSFRFSIQPRTRVKAYKFKPHRAKTKCPTVF